jgi:hypothetical protein
MELLTITGTMLVSVGAALAVQRALLGAMLYAIDPKRATRH